MKMSYVVLCVMLIILLLGKTEVSMSLTCSPLELSPCAAAIMSSSPPTTLCCQKLKDQRPCLCQYVKDPNLQKLVKSANAKKVASTCGTPFPTC
ncbi:hypothetical protein UlMin_040476 [Ulmus minor]